MKKVLLLFCFLILTGCKAEYNIIFENNVVKESLNVTALPNDIVDGEPFKTKIDDYSSVLLLVNYTDQPGNLTDSEIKQKYPVYSKSIINENGLYGININYSHSIDSIVNSSIIHTLFRKVSVSEKAFTAYQINDIFSSYTDLDEITVSFKTDKKVEESNADKVDNNVYYWILNKENYSNKNIKIRFDTSLEQEKIIDISTNNGWNVIYIILGIIGIGVLVSILVIYEKVKKSNN